MKKKRKKGSSKVIQQRSGRAQPSARQPCLPVTRPRCLTGDCTRVSSSAAVLPRRPPHRTDTTVHPGGNRLQHSLHIAESVKFQVKYLFIKHSGLKGQGMKDGKLCLPFSLPLTHFTSSCVFISWYSQYISDSYDETSGRFHCKAAGSLSRGSCCFAV